MADVARVSQATWSRWEHGVSAPSLPHLDNIRAEALRRKLAWDDRWFFYGAGRTGGSTIANGVAEAAN